MSALNENQEIHAGDTRTLRFRIMPADALLLDLEAGSVGLHIEWWMADNSAPTFEQVRIRLTDANGAAVVEDGGRYWLEVDLLEEHTATLLTPKDYYHEARVSRGEAEAVVVCAGMIAVRRSAIARSIIGGYIPVPEPSGSVTLAAAIRAETAADLAETARDEAQAFAESAGETISDGVDAAAASAAAAEADRVQTGLDVIATAADRVQTGLDVVATAADRVQTGLDRADVTTRQGNVASIQSDVTARQSDVISRQTDVTTKHNNVVAKHGEVQTAASAVASDKLAVEGLLASFRGVHLGSYANDAAANAAATSYGVTLVDGVQYSNTTTNQIRIWFDGAWADYDASSEQQTAAAQLSAGQAAASAALAQGYANDASTSATAAGAEKTAAQTARTGAETARTGAETARTGAETALTGAGAARTGAETAQTGAQAARTGAESARTGAEAARDTAAGSATAAAGSASAAATSAGAAAGSAASALAIYGSTAAQQAAVAQAQAQASLAAGHAASASAVAQLDVSGVTAAALHRSPNAISSMFIYDTSKDSDGGAWTDKCQHTSWYNEPLMGKWITAGVVGGVNSEAAARALGGTLGPNLMAAANGTTAGWTPVSTSIIATDGALLRVTNPSTGGSAAVNWVQAVTSGKTYLVRASGYLGTSTAAPQMRVSGDGGGSWTLVPTGTATGCYLFVATSNSVTVQFYNQNTQAGWSVLFGDFSLQEVISYANSGDYYQAPADGKFYRLWKNLLQRSDEFDNAIWQKVNVSVSANATAAPDGATTADNIVPTATSGAHRIAQTGGVNFSAGSTVTVYAKANGYSKIAFCESTNSSFGSDIVDLSNGSVITASARQGTTTATAVGNGWYRVTWTGNTLTGIVNNVLAIVICDPAATTGYYPWQATWTANGTDGVYLWGAQLERNITAAATAYEAKGADAGISETFRGNKADFPKLAAIVGEASSLTIYDLNEPGRPMWMRFITGGGGYGSTGIRLLYSNSVSVRALNGVFAVAGTGSWASSLLTINFARDLASWYGPGGSFNRGEWDVGLSRRNEAPMWTLWLDNTNNIRSYIVRAVDLCAFLDAPVDPVTGLRSVTVAAATDIGVSLIGPSGVVRNSSSSISFTNVVLTPSLLSAGRADGTWYYAYNPATLASSFALSTRINSQAPGFGIGDTNQLIGTGRSRLIRRSTAAALAQIARMNESDPARALVINIANTHNTGWLPGDIRRCLLSTNVAGQSSSAGNIVDPLEYANQAAAEAAGWIFVDTTLNNNTITFTGTSIQLYTDTSVGTPYLYKAFSCVVGETYRITVSGVGGPQQMRTGFGSFVTAQNSNMPTLLFAPGTAYAVATATTMYVRVGVTNGVGTGTIDAIEVVAVNRDVSYKSSSANITGTLTKTQLATGTSLVGYSGWSASNYLREAYSADLDFGTGEWSCSAWVNVPTMLTVGMFPAVGAPIIANDVGAAPWQAPTGGSVASGTWTATAGNQAIRIPFTAGKIYRLRTTGVVNSGNFAFVSEGAGTNWGSANGSIDRIIIGNSTFLLLYCISPGSVTISAFELQELGPAPVFDRAHSSGPRLRLGLNGYGYLEATAFDGATTRTVTTSSAYNNATWLKAEACYTVDGSLSIRVNGREVAVTRGNPLLSVNSRYNLVLYSQDFSNAVWSIAPGFSSKVSTTVADPNSGSSACEIAFTAANGYLQQNSVFVVGKTYTISFWARRDAGSNMLRVATNTGASLGTFSPNNSWQKFTITATISGGTHMLLQDTSGSGWTNVQFAFVQVEEGSAAKTYQRVGAATDFDFQAPLTIGNSFATDAPFPGSIALLKLGATVPTYDQSLFMYEQEKQMFRANAQTVLPDANSIIDMAYDDATDRWVAISSSNESYWTGLVRNSVTPVPAGSYSKVAATSGVELIARATTLPGVDVTLPPLGLREELARRAEAAAKASRELTAYDFVGGFTATTVSGNTAITSVANLSYPTSYIGARVSGSGIPANTTIVGVSGTTIYLSAAATASASNVSISFLDFALPVGMTAKTVISAGAVRQEGATKDYTRLWDGFYETIRFAVAPGATAWVQIQATRDAAQ